MPRQKTTQETDVTTIPMDVTAIAGLYAFHKLMNKPFSPYIEHPTKSVAYEIMYVDEDNITVIKIENARENQAYFSAKQRYDVEVSGLVRAKNNLLIKIKTNMEIMDRALEEQKKAPNDVNLQKVVSDAHSLIKQAEVELAEVEAIIEDKKSMLLSKPAPITKESYDFNITEIF